MSKYKNDSTVAVIATCAIIFCSFTFLFVHQYQGTTLAYAQHSLSGGATVYNDLVSAVLITIVGIIIQIITLRITRLGGSSYSLSYLPSFLGLALITGIYPDAKGGVHEGSWIWLLPVILLLYAAGVKLLQQWLSVSRPTTPGYLSSRATLVNVGTMILMMLFTVKVSNGDRMFHRQMNAEKMIMEQDYRTLSHEGEGQEHTNPTITLMRFIAMDKVGTLADSLFYAPVEGSEASLLRLEGIKPYLFRPQFLSRRKSPDYRLCAMLVDRNLDAFAHRLQQICDVNDPAKRDSLPRHYKEALVMYQHTETHAVTQFVDSVMETDYRDMRDMMRQCGTDNQRRDMLRRNYSNTYWYYYLVKNDV